MLLLQVYLTASFGIALANENPNTAFALKHGCQEKDGLTSFPDFVFWKDYAEAAEGIKEDEAVYTSEDQNNDIHTDRPGLTHRRTASWSSRFAQWCCGKMEHTDDQSNEQPSSSQNEMKNDQKENDQKGNDQKENDDPRQRIDARKWVNALARYPAESAGRRVRPWSRPPSAFRRLFGGGKRSY